MKLIVILAVLGLSVSDCNNSTTFVNPQPVPVVKDSEFCQQAEVHLKELKCISSTQPYTKKGKSFTQFCQEKQDQGISIEPKCLSNITSCDQMDVCTHTSTGVSK